MTEYELMGNVIYLYPDGWQVFVSAVSDGDTRVEHGMAEDRESAFALQDTLAAEMILRLTAEGGIVTRRDVAE